MDEDDCMVSVAKFFLDFTMDETCGKCTPCRIGSKRLYEILDKITKGHGTHADLARLKTLCESIKDTALCGLGQTMPNPILSTMDTFANEYEAHVTQKKCPAHVCTAMLTYTIDAAKCTGCTLCTKVCPVDCISGTKGNRMSLTPPSASSAALATTSANSTPSSSCKAEGGLQCPC